MDAYPPGTHTPMKAVNLGRRPEGRRWALVNGPEVVARGMSEGYAKLFERLVNEHVGASGE